MSTIAKLDRSVRLDRMLRKQQRREMSSDLKTVEALIARGRRMDTTAWDTKAKKNLAGPMQELLIHRTVLEMTLQHVTKICKDPKRTGAAKERILAQLGAVEP